MNGGSLIFLPLLYSTIDSIPVDVAINAFPSIKSGVLRIMLSCKNTVFKTSVLRKILVSSKLEI